MTTELGVTETSKPRATTLKSTSFSPVNGVGVFLFHKGKLRPNEERHIEHEYFFME